MVDRLDTTRSSPDRARISDQPAQKPAAAFPVFSEPWRRGF